MSNYDILNPMKDDKFKRIQQAALDSLKHPGKTAKKLPKQESKKYPEIYVFRHGETYDNRRRIFSGWRDSKLTPRGVAQARKLQGALAGKDIDFCIVSRLSRSKDTARIALKNHPDVMFETDDRIIERNYGDLQGKSKEKMMRENPQLAVKYRRSYEFPPPNGESLKMVEARVLPFCQELEERVKKNNVNIAISAHGNSMRVIRKYFEKLSIIEELTMENPLGEDYAQYVIKTRLGPKNLQ